MAAYGRGAVARPIVAVEIASGSLVFTTYALLDCGANCCGISKDMVLKFTHDGPFLKVIWLVINAT